MWLELMGGGLLACCAAYVIFNLAAAEFRTWRRSFRVIVKLLLNMGYHPKQISNILDFYD